MLKLTELNNYSELALALKTSISAFKNSMLVKIWQTNFY